MLWVQDPRFSIMPFFSLIVPTKDRTTELAQLVASLDAQSDQDFELIVVDQNPDNRIEAILRQSARGQDIIWLRAPAGASLARNCGIRRAQGTVMAFPDDDCWYPEGTIAHVKAWFLSHPEMDILSLASRDADGVPSGNRWRSESCAITTWNAFRTTVCYCFFVRRSERAQRVAFDEQIGPGGTVIAGAGEDTDYVLQAMDAGLRAHFLRKWHIGHPRKDVRNGSIQPERSFRYGVTMGYVQRKHNLRLVFAGSVLYDMARAAAMMALGRRQPATLWYQHGRGLMAGFMHAQARGSRGAERKYVGN